MPTTRPALFGDDPTLMPIEGSLVKRSKASTPRSKRERTVDRLLKQVETLRTELERKKRRLDDALILHAAEIRPRQECLIDLRTNAVLALARFLDDRRLTKADAGALRSILLGRMDELLAQVVTPADDIKALFERLHGLTYDEAVNTELAEARSHMAEFFDEAGLDMDVPELRPDMSDKEAAAAFAEMADRMREQAAAAYERTAARPGRSASSKKHNAPSARRKHAR